MGVSGTEMNDLFHDDFGDSGVARRAPPAIWPPRLNAFGMVGQESLVDTLEELIRFSAAKKLRLADKIIVGGAGLGKSSLARAIARKLTDGHCLLLNGADISDPGGFVDALAAHGLFGEFESGAYPVEESIIFIDEAHALRKRVVAWLLSALDDARTTSHKGKRYSFHKASFILATTDPGALPETFRTRAESIFLRPYTLEEIAGIVWTHAHRALDGWDLPFNVCEEIGARMRANPRRAVRIIEQALIPHAFVRLTDSGVESPTSSEIGMAITVDMVASYFERLGIDVNGLDDSARTLLSYLQKNGSVPEARLCQALGISNKNDFLALDEYLHRLGLIAISSRGRELTTLGRRYTQLPFPLRSRISNSSTPRVAD